MDLHICRLCTNSNCELHPIFSNQEKIMEKITLISDIQIATDDGLPNMICDTCSQKLNISYDFRLQIISTDEKLKLQILNQNFKEDPEDLEPDTILPLCEINNVTNSCDKFEENQKKEQNGKELVNKRARPRLKEKVKAIKIKPEILICPKCGKILKRNSFTDHMLNIHSQEATIECNICGKMCKSRRQLWHHKRSHKKENINCDKCGKIFTTKRAFRAHYDNIHLGKKNYKCTLCEKSFAKSEVLKQHMRTHTGEKPFVCPHCSRGFNGRWAMKQHIWLHTNERPYKCTICSEGFAQNVTLKLHIKRKHNVNFKNELEKT